MLRGHQKRRTVRERQSSEHVIRTTNYLTTFFTVILYRLKNFAAKRA